MMYQLGQWDAQPCGAGGASRAAPAAPVTTERPASAAPPTPHRNPAAGGGRSVRDGSRRGAAAASRSPTAGPGGPSARAGAANAGTVPARDQRARRRVAPVGAMAGERATAGPVMEGAPPVEPCATPCFGANALLAGEPRLVAKLHRSRPGGWLPARASFSLRVDTPRIPQLKAPTQPAARTPPGLPASRDQTAFAPHPTRSVAESI